MFFFSSRRRHTRFDCDWSSDVCSSDLYGHLTGSRALVRIGKVLRSHSRAIDTPARYGGDEFALVLPEAGKDIATRVVTRIRERLAAEAEDRKSTRLNSSHSQISYAVFCLKK